MACTNILFMIILYFNFKNLLLIPRSVVWKCNFKGLQKLPVHQFYISCFNFWIRFLAFAKKSQQIFRHTRSVFYTFNSLVYTFDIYKYFLWLFYFLKSCTDSQNCRIKTQFVHMLWGAEFLSVARSSSRFGFFDALNISGHLASLSTGSVKSPTNFVQRHGGSLTSSRELRIPDLKFWSVLFWMSPVGLASGAGSVTLPTSFEGKGPHLKQWLVTLLSAPDSFLTELFRGFPKS